MIVLNGPHKDRIIVSRNPEFVHVDRLEPGFSHISQLTGEILNVDDIMYRDRHQVITHDGEKFLLYLGTKVAG